MRNLSQFSKSGMLIEGIPQGFNQDKFGIVIDSCFYFLQIIHIHKVCLIP